MILDQARRQGQRAGDERRRADDAPGKLITALSAGHDIVVLTGGPDRAVAEIVAATFPLLHKAGFAAASITAPLSLSVLHDAIREVLVEPVVRERPLIVVIEHAENLLLPAVRRLVALSALRRDTKPVLQFLLAGKTELWSALRSAGVANLAGDATAHVRVALAAVATTAPDRPRIALETRAAPGRLAEDGRSGRVVVRIIVGLVLTFLVAGGIGSVSWEVFGPKPQVAALEPEPSADEQLAALLRIEDEQIAGGQLQSPRAGDLIRTRQRIDALIPSLSQAGLDRLGRANRAIAMALQSHTAAAIHAPAAQAPVVQAPVVHAPVVDAPVVDAPVVDAPVVDAPVVDAPASMASSAPANLPVHVTVRYRIGAAGALAHAGQIMARLKDQDVPADGPVGLSSAVGDRHTAAMTSGLEFYFAQDRPVADRMSHLLLPADIHPVLHHVSSGAPPRPGEISIIIGAQDDPGAHSVGGGQT